MTAPDNNFYIKQGDTSPSIAEYLRNADGTAIPLTGATVKFSMKAPDGTIKINLGSAVIDDPTNALVHYDWNGADTNTAGVFSREWQVTLASGRIVTVPNAPPSNDGYLVVITGQIA